MRKTWTASEESYIKENIKSSRKEMAEYLGVTVPAVNSKIQKMKKYGQLGEPALVKKEIPVKKAIKTKDPTLLEAFDIIDEKEQENQALRDKLEIKSKELHEYQKHNKKHLDTISSLHKELASHEKDTDGHQKHIQELNTALKYREKIIEDLKGQIADFNPYHEGMSESVPKSCFEKLTEQYQKLEVKYTEARLEIEDMRAYDEMEATDRIADENVCLMEELRTHKRFLNVIEALAIGGHDDF